MSQSQRPKAYGTKPPRTGIKTNTTPGCTVTSYTITYPEPEA